jgi:hypothetical protein
LLELQVRFLFAGAAAGPSLVLATFSRRFRAVLA